MSAAERKPEIVVFAGPNGSGKSTITSLLRPVDVPYVNADDIQRILGCGNMEAAKMAERQREGYLEQKKSFCFETVLSTQRNLNLLKRAKEQGFFIRCYYVLTVDPAINLARVQARVMSGGHDVPPEKWWIGTNEHWDWYMNWFRCVMSVTSMITLPTAPTVSSKSEKNCVGIVPRGIYGTKRILWP